MHTHKGTQLYTSLFRTHFDTIYAHIGTYPYLDKSLPTHTHRMHTLVRYTFVRLHPQTGPDPEIFCDRL